MTRRVCQFRLPVELFNYIYFITRDRAACVCVRAIFSIVDKLECPYDLRMSALSSYDRRKFYHTLPVFKSPLLRNINFIARKANPDKRNKVDKHSWRRRGRYSRRDPTLTTRRKVDAEIQRGKREKEMLLPPLDPMRILVFLRRMRTWVAVGNKITRGVLAVVTYLKVIKCRQYIWTTWTSRLFLHRVYLPSLSSAEN